VSHDRRPDRLQIVYGLLGDRDGRLIAVEVFEGDVGDLSTLSAQISKLKQRFGLTHMVLVGDRGMITSAHTSVRISSRQPSRLSISPARLDLHARGLAGHETHAIRNVVDLDADRDALRQSDPGENRIHLRETRLPAHRIRNGNAAGDAGHMALKHRAVAHELHFRPVAGADRRE
jgi:hypothetical protein